MRRTALMTLLSDWLPKLLTFVATVLVARRLGSAEFGEFALALSWIGYAWWAIDLGQAGYSIRTLADADGPARRRLGSEILSLYLALALVVTTVTVVLAGASRSRTGSGTLLLAMSPFLLSYAAFPDWWLRASGLLRELAVANWSVSVSFLTAVLVIPGGRPVLDALAFGLSPLPGAAVALAVLARERSFPLWCPSIRAWGRHLRTSLLFSAAGAGGQLATPLALSAMTRADPSAAGAFGLGLRASGAAANALWLLLHNALPRLLKQRRRRPQVRQLLAAALLPLALLAVGAAVWPTIGPSVLGSSFAPVGGYLALGVGLLVVWGPKYLVEIELIASYGDRRRIAMNLVAPALVLGLLLVGPAAGRAWTVPLALLLGEVLATALGWALLGVRGGPPGLRQARPVALGQR